MSGRAFRAYGLEAAASPDPRLDLDLVGRPADEMKAVRLAEPVGTWPTEARRGGEHQRAPVVVAERLECVPFDGRPLVDVPTENELGARGREGPEHRVPVLERELPRRPPRSAREVVMADDDPQRTRRGSCQDRTDRSEPLRVEAAALMPPRAARVEPAGDGVGGTENGVGGAEDGLEGLPRARDARGQGVWDVVVPGNGQCRHLQPVEQGLRLLELRPPAAVGEIAARDHELGLEVVTECHERVVELGSRVGSPVEVGDVDRAGGHGRTRLYTRSMSEQSPEIFDDLYLGLQAGGAMRKQRRGEELTEQEAAALSRWQRLSMWRKGVAIGAFAFGTFGLGFTLGGLIFGRRRATR